MGDIAEDCFEREVNPECEWCSGNNLLGHEKDCPVISRATDKEIQDEYPKPY